MRALGGCAGTNETVKGCHGVPHIDIDALEEEWEDDHHWRSGPHSQESLSRAARQRIDSYDTGRVVGVDRGRVTLLYGGEVVEATLAGTMRGDKAAVGDFVRVRPARHAGDTPRVVETLPRETVLTRTGDDEADDERVVVANADQIVVVLAADNLEGDVGFLDRVLVAAGVGGLDAVVCINRDDLTDGVEVAAVAERYADLGLPVVRTSAVTGAGLARLEELISGCWSAFSGHSGVGKTALFNRLVPDAERVVGEMGPRGGRHTTVSSLAMRVPSLDAWLVDTPGVRSFGLGGLRPEELAAQFPELAGLDCDLDDCCHDGEPGCALETAVIHPARLSAYRRLLAALRGAA